MSSDVSTSTTASDALHLGLGDRLRLWWDALAAPDAVAGRLPDHRLHRAPARPPACRSSRPSAPTSAASSPSSACTRCWRSASTSSSARPVCWTSGYVGFYAIGAYTVGLLTSPDSPWNLTDDWLSRDWAWLFAVPVAIARDRPVRAPARHTDPAAARRLPGHRHPRVRRDRAAPGRQPHRADRRRPGSLADRLPGRRGQRGTAERGVLGRQHHGTAQLRGVLVLAVDGADHHRAGDRRKPRAVPRRSVLGGHPRGRGRRRDHGRAHLQVQAVGVRHRRVDRWPVRCALRGPGPVRGAVARSTSSTRCCSCAPSSSAARATSSASSRARSSSCTCPTSSSAAPSCSASRSTATRSPTTSTCSSGSR